MAIHPDNNWKSVPVHVIDFEGNRGSGVVEFGVATLLGGEIVEARSEFCRPHGRIPRREEELHGISERDLLGALPLEDHWEYFAKLRDTGPLGAHHASVEEGLLKREWSHPRLSTDFLNPGKLVSEWGPWVDTKELYNGLFPSLPSFALGNLAHAFGLMEELEELGEKYCPPGRNQFHAALFDAMASALLLTNLEKFPEIASRMTLRWMLTQSMQGAAKKQAAFQAELFMDM
jgi:DNA polymerase III epsilon subunit-like protein